MVQFYGQEVLIKNDEKTRDMTLTVNSNGQIVVKVRCGLEYDEKEVQNFVDQNKRFLKNRQKDYASVRLPDFNNGGKVWLLGKEYEVVRNENIGIFSISDNQLKVPNNFLFVQLEGFLENLLLPYVRELTKLYAEQYDLKYSAVRVSNYVSSWGKFVLPYEYICYDIALAFLPEECIEYVVVHELCHSKHHNHSAEFWADVERMCPQYRESRSILKSYYTQWIFERAQ